MDKKKRATAAALCAIALCLLWIPAAYANSAEPPSIHVILSGSVPEDLGLTVLLSDGSEITGKTTWKAWERTDAFYKLYMSDAQPVALRARAREVITDYPLTSTNLQKYSNQLTLNLNSGKISVGQQPVRAATLVGMRVLLTLLIEGAIFWLFGYRTRRSYIVFLAVNLVTQGALNLVLNNAYFPDGGYIVFGLLICEFFVFLAEMIAMPILLKEHRKRRAVWFAFAANTASLFAGGYMLTLLPV